MKAIVIYDDTMGKSEMIEDIIGGKGFADIVIKNKYLEDWYKEELKRIYPDLVWKKVSSIFEYADIAKDLELYRDSDVKVMHCFSNYMLADSDVAGLTFKKLQYVDEPFGVRDGKRAVAAMFPGAAEYIKFLKSVISGQHAWDVAKSIAETVEIEGAADIGEIGNFIHYVTGNFDSRYFNSLEEDDYTLVKTSSNKKKIKAEYEFYHLLPEDMKYWFVLPFNYTEDEDSASYTMERLHMTDLAIKWVHGSMDRDEFSKLMDMYFYFFKSRHSKDCSEDEYKSTADALYIDKVNNRIADLKTLEGYKTIEKMIDASGNFTLDGLVDKYFELKNKIEARNKYERKLVIGHGDPCFANALYNKPTKTLKFIDPKGAMSEEELWTNEYYDVAKLSHSVCGRYDFFNNALFNISVDKDFGYTLEIPFDNQMYKEIFKAKLEENGFDYMTVRIYEASLFLSMLPLHIDNPHKVFGFILNAKNILEEIEKDV